MTEKAKITADMNEEEDEIKKVIAALIQNFVQEEQGNRVTSNNMLALTVMINQALDGKISLKPEPQ